MEHDGIDPDEWPTDSSIKWQNLQARPKEEGLHGNSSAKPPPLR